MTAEWFPEEIVVSCDLCQQSHNSLYNVDIIEDCNPFFSLDNNFIKKICTHCINLNTKRPPAKTYGYTIFPVSIDWYFPKEEDVLLSGDAFVESFGKNTYIVKFSDGYAYNEEIEWYFQCMVKGNTVTGNGSKKYKGVALEIVDLYKKKLLTGA